MALRAWRNFDFVLIGALLILSAFGATMIYSATINTAGVEDATRRQIVYVVAGTVLLLVAAAVDYRWVEVIQVPFPFLVPLVLSVAAAGVSLAWLARQPGLAEGNLWAAFLASGAGPTLAGAGLVVAVFLADRRWIEVIDLPAARAAAVAAVLLGAAAAALYVTRLPADRLGRAMPYLVAGGLAVAYLLDCLTLRITDALKNLLYVAVLGSLGLVAVLGQVAGGAQSWLGAGTIQPSEPAKVLVILVLAKFLADHEERMERIGTVLSAAGMVAVPVLLVYLQPDLGTAMVFVAIWAGMIWAAGIRLRHLLILLVCGLGGLPLLWFGLEDYMRSRLLLFLNPASDPDSYFNVHQALVSIGSGGWTGKGLTHGTQSQLHFLRVRHTDFIFAVTAEELGFLGAVAMLALLALLLWRMLRVAGQARDTFGRLIAAGVATMILFQAAVNIGMNLGLLPVTGLPLPFVSYGGSSFLTLMLGAGMVESVAMRHKKLEFG